MTDKEKARFAVKLAHVFERAFEHTHDQTFDVIVILRDPAGDGGKPVVGAVASRIDTVTEMLDQARRQLGQASAHVEAAHATAQAEDEQKTSTKGGN